MLKRSFGLVVGVLLGSAAAGAQTVYRLPGGKAMIEHGDTLWIRPLAGARVDTAIMLGRGDSIIRLKPLPVTTFSGTLVQLTRTLIATMKEGDKLRKTVTPH